MWCVQLVSHASMKVTKKLLIKIRLLGSIECVFIGDLIFLTSK